MKRQLAVSVLVLLSCFLAPAARAQEAPPPEIEKLVKELRFVSGDVELQSGLATLHLRDAYRFLGAEDSERVLVDVWGNPPKSGALGMIFPKDLGPLDDGSWAVVLEYQQDGYVSDADASAIDFQALLADMQSSTRETNEERQKAGYAAVNLVGWAEPPHYDAQAHKLYWAKELDFQGTEEHALNYNIRILGRRGVLVLNAVSGMGNLASVKSGMHDVLGVVDFNSGHRYTDFNPSVDQVAAYGIAALVAGTVAAKAGLLAKLGVVLLAMKKLVVVAAVGVVGLFRRLFGRDRSETPAAQ